MTQLGELSRTLPVEANVLVISTDDRQASSRLAARLPNRERLTFLSDRGGTVIDHYGLRDPRWSGVPVPATFVVDRHGVISWRFVERDYRRRAPSDAVLAAWQVVAN